MGVAQYNAPCSGRTTGDQVSFHIAVGGQGRAWGCAVCCAPCRPRILGITMVIKCPCAAMLLHKAKQGCGTVLHTGRGKVALANKGNHRGNQNAIA